MKGFKSFIIYMFVTILIYIIAASVFNQFINNEEILDYNLSSSVVMSSNGNIIKEGEIAFDKCINQNGDAEIDFLVESRDIRKVQSEISLLVNYEQTDFRVGNNEKLVNNYKFKVNSNNPRKLKIIIDKKIFNLHNNQLIIVIRNDINMHVFDNELLQDSNAQKLMLNIRNISSNKLKNLKILKPVKHEKISKTSETQMTLKCINRDNKVLITANKNELIKMKLNFSEKIKSKKYIIFAYFNSHQINISNENAFTILSKKDYDTVFELSFNAPYKKGIYEFELFAIPLKTINKIENLNYRYKIISANKYTIKVE